MNLSDLLPVSEPPIGSIVLAETSPGDDYIAADGLARLRASYPELADIYTRDIVPWEQQSFHETGLVPDTQPANTPNDVRISPDGRWVAVARNTSPFLDLYDMSGGTMILIAAPASLPTGQTNLVVWSPDSRYVLFTHNASPYFTIYDLSTGTPVKLANPATLVGSAPNFATWSPSGNFFAVATGSSPFLHIYNMQSGQPVKTSAPDVALSGSPNFILAWSVNDILACMDTSGSPYIRFYGMNTGHPVKMANPVSLPAGSLWPMIAWSPNGRYCAMGVNGSPWLMVYDFQSGVPVNVSIGIALSSYPVSGAGIRETVVWTPNSEYLIAVSAGSPYNLNVTRFSGGSATTFTIDAGIAPGDKGVELAVSPNSDFFLLRLSASPYLYRYKLTSSGVFERTNAAAESSNTISDGSTTMIRWSSDNQILLRSQASGQRLLYCRVLDVNRWTEFKVPLVVNGWVKAT